MLLQFAVVSACLWPKHAFGPSIPVSMPPHRSNAGNERLRELKLAIQQFPVRGPPSIAVTTGPPGINASRRASGPPSAPGPAGIHGSGPMSEPPGIDGGSASPKSSGSSTCPLALLAPWMVITPRWPLPPPLPPPPGLGLSYFVISLRDSTGEARLSNMNLRVTHKVIDGVLADDVPR